MIFYVVMQKSTGLFLSDYDKHLNLARFKSKDANAATWISEKCIDGIYARYLIKIQEDIQILQAPNYRYI